VTPVRATGDIGRKIFLIATEESGDRLGANLMKVLRQRLGDAVRFEGVGGRAMAREGLTSLFPIEELSIIGLAAVVKQLPKILRPKFTLGALVKGFWINPVAHPAFGWTLLGRILVNLGNALGTTLLLYFIMYGLNRPETAEDDLLSLTFVYLVTFIIAALGFGRLCDVLGRRKVFVYVAAYLQGIAALLLAFVPDLSIAYVGAGLLGLGYGCFMSVDQALATQVLPDSHTRGKDLGIMNIATAVPQAVAPLLGAFIVAAIGGFPALFIGSAVFAALGGLAIIPIKSVK
jgi:MFS family permease